MPDSPARPAETALYPALKSFLEARGFAVKGEVCGCDIVAVRGGEAPLLVVTEIKLSFTLELVLQAVDRLHLADEVWLAVVASRRGQDRDRRVRKLCRFLGVGLLAEPAPYKPRINLAQRKKVLREHGRRRGDPAVGGSTRQPIMTAYRQRALECLAVMRDGPKRPRDLRGVAEDAGGILLRNVYGWFEKVRPGVYRLSKAGVAQVGMRVEAAE